MQEQPSTAPRQNYTERLEARRVGLAIRERRHSTLSNFRGLVFLAGVALAFVVFTGLGFSPWWLLLPAASFWWFGWQLELEESARTRFARGVTYYERALARLDHRWSGTGEGGQRFLDERERHLFASDLDIFGRGSLFELLCQARTHMGQEVLSEWLLKPATPDAIRSRQEAVKDMAPRLDLREDLAALGENARRGIRAEVLYAWGERQPVFEPSWFRVFAWGLSALGAMGVIAFLTCLMAMLSILKLPEKTVVGLEVYFLSLTIVYTAVLRRFRKRTNQIIHDLDDAAPDLNLIAGVLGRLETERFTSPRLAMLHTELEIEGLPPSRRIAQLNRLVELVDSRKNQAMAIIGPLLLWDLHLSYAIEDWRRTSGIAMRRWLSAAGEMEAIASIGAYYYEHPDDVFPELLAKQPHFEGKGLGHPLLPDDQIVRNDVYLAHEPSVLVVSGSNMSGRLIAQFLTESLVLAGLGVIAGCAFALPGMRFLETLVPDSMGPVQLTLDWRVLAFSVAATIAAALIFGLAPALRGSRVAPQEGLRDGGRGATGPRSHWPSYSLIMLETALAVVLLTCSGLLLQTFLHLRNTDLGIRSEKLLTFEMALFRYKEFDRRVAFINAQLDKVRSIPGAINAGAINRLPFTNLAHATFYRLEGQSGDVIPGQVALIRNVSRDYFATVGAGLREGRFFEASDRKSDSPVATINEPLANRHFPGRSPLGQRLKFGELGENGYWYTVAGVVKPIRESGVLNDAKPAIYRVFEQCDQVDERLTAGIVVRTAVEPEAMISSVRQAVWSIDKNQPVARIQTMEAIIDRQLSTPSQSTTLLSAFAVLALLLASLGIYGVLSSAVTQRTNEIGVRMALGAKPSEILLSFGKRGLALTLTGLVIGLVLAAIAARWMTSLLYGFRPDYAPTVSAVSLILLGVAALACFVPARRASRVDPVIALRNE